MNRNLCALCALVVVTLLVFLPCRAAEPSTAKPFRPPAVPLVTHHPYFSVWSPADRLSDAPTVHWTGKRNTLSSLIRVDGQTFRLLGSDPDEAPPMPQHSTNVQPTRTICDFATEEVRVTLTFTSPLLPDDFDILGRPVTYITWQVVAVDGEDHRVSLYFDGSAELVVNVPEQTVDGAIQDADSTQNAPGLAIVRLGSKEQPVLSKKGDDLRIDWGYLYAAVEKNGDEPLAFHDVASGPTAREAFLQGKGLSESLGPKLSMPRAASDAWPSAVFVLDLGNVGERPITRTLMLAYDEIYAIRYMGQRLRPYWRRSGADAVELLRTAARDRTALFQRCEALDLELTADLTRTGGQRYAWIAALAYRQCLAANGLAADSNGMPLFFPKEHFSNGCIGTVDVTYPMAPLFLLFGPSMAKATLVPILDYAESPLWKHPFAPHDLGTYPHADGQVYGGGEVTEENQMPVEESGNLLLLVAAVVQAEEKADFAARYWPVLTRWAEYLLKKGRDPENQLCTDDFAGHLAHNVNLSAKAILALGAYARLCETLGKKEEAASYRKTAEEFVRQWVREAADGDHYRLAFDLPGTWSQKYNLVWDRILGLRLFPEEVLRTEMAFYRKIQKRYGLPLDNRSDFTKLDWITWTATLTGSREDFDALVGPVCAFLCETPDRVPMTDWYWTTNAKVQGFRARPVVGAVFIKLLDDSKLWAKWAARGAKVAGSWAPLPQR